MRFSLHFHKTDDEKYGDIKYAAKEKDVNDLDSRLYRAREKTKTILNNQKTQKIMEESFFKTSENTKNNVVYWSFIQILLLIIVATSQVFYLRSYFIKKKLV